MAIIWGMTFIIIILITINSNIQRNFAKQLKAELQLQYSYEEATQENIHNGLILKKYSSLLEINDEIVGWIRINNTKVDYPVVKGMDNEFYLNSNINKEPFKAGSIFMDFRNEGKGLEPHTIVYGHHMKDGSMFGDLMKYKERSFLIENRYIQFNTLYEDIKWEIFSAYITDTGFDYLITEFSNKEDYIAFLESITTKSYMNLGTEVSVEDKILTLSTCTYEFKDARFVVHAKKLLN